MLRKLLGSRQPAKMTIDRPRASGRPSRWESGAARVPARRRVRVESIRAVGAGAVEFTVTPVDGQPIPFRAGQYFTHCVEIDGRPLRRAYSVSSGEADGPLTFACKRVEGGCVSGYFNEQLAVGDEYELLGPSGDFVLPDEARAPLVFVAGGSGITPIIGLLETALAKDPHRDCRLIYASRDEPGIILRDRLDALASRSPGLSMTHVLSRPASDWGGAKGRLSGARAVELAAADAPLGDEAIWYLCGPGGLMDAVAEALAAQGVDDQRIRREQFVSAHQVAGSRPQSPQPIRFRKSALDVQQAPGQSLLDAALGAGIALDFSCTVGGCGACKVKVLDGEVGLDEPNCLSETERAAGYTLACSAWATGPCEVEA